MARRKRTRKGNKDGQPTPAGGAQQPTPAGGAQTRAQTAAAGTKKGLPKVDLKLKQQHKRKKEEKKQAKKYANFINRLRQPAGPEFQRTPR